MGTGLPSSIAPNRPAEILLVEDDEGDALLTEKALQKSSVPINLRVVGDGDEALRYLAKEGEFTWAVRPDLILLDLNLPGTHGRDVLESIKMHQDWRRIPVIILTSSKAESDILRSYDTYCNAYMVKPGDPDVFAWLADTLGAYWFDAAVLAAR